MIWHWQVDFHHSEQGTHKAFHATIGQVKYFFDRQHNLNGLICIIKLASTLYHGFVIFRPVFDTVKCFLA